MKDLWIFDLDGTLADSAHRVHFLENKEDPERWNKFYDACTEDPPFLSTTAIFRALVHAGHDVVIFTGRSERVKDQTIRWLCQNVTTVVNYSDILVMRPEGNHELDVHLKKHWYYHWLGQRDRDRLKGVFEDRTSMVKMWRGLGIPCFQVAPGDF